MRNTKTSILYYQSLLFLIPLFFINLLTAQTTFIEGQDISGTIPAAVKFADVDGDNDLDLIRTLYRPSGLNTNDANEVWLNDGEGNFTFYQSFGNLQGRDLDVGDLDGDNDIDIFITNNSDVGGSHLIYIDQVWFNDGHGNFIDSEQNLGYRKSDKVILADLDGDADLDAFITYFLFDVARPNSVWINNGAGQFTEGHYMGNPFFQDLTLADIDGDQNIDAITATEGYISLWINNGFGEFSNDRIMSDVILGKVTAFDIDGDLDIDLVFSNLLEGLKIYKNDGNGEFNFHADIILDSVRNFKVVEFSDIDNDGDDDLIGQSRILINDGLGNFTEDFLFNARDSTTTDIAIGDIDNDGDNDLFFSNINNQSKFWLNQLPKEVIPYCPPLLKVKISRQR